MKLLNLSQYASSYPFVDTMSITAEKTVYVKRDFFVKNAHLAAMRSLVPKNQLEIINYIQNSIFTSFTYLEGIYNIMCADLPDLPPLNDQGELDYSGCPKPFMQEILFLASKGIIGIVDWDDPLSVHLFWEDISDLTCYAYFSDKEAADDQKRLVAHLSQNNNICELFADISCTPENFKRWAGVLCQGNISGISDWLGLNDFGITLEQRNFILKAIIYLIATDSMMLCDGTFANPIYGCMRGFKILPNFKMV